MKKIMTTILLTLALSAGLSAQRVSISTNFADWAQLGTVNLALGVGISQHFSFQAGAKYNPWQFENEKQNMDLYIKQQCYHAGFRYWPWYVNSGWWLGLKGQYRKFSDTGIWRPAIEKVSAAGAGFSFGYDIMLGKHFDIELGAGVWGGKYLDYTLHKCKDCMEVRESGSRLFFGADDVIVSLVYIF
ncbi:MAG: DUF3575 domain-containing protein [Bacteroidales bacterium]|nr:DUF3575 domain-containing protein [Bacteroidales bacterium]